MLFTATTKSRRGVIPGNYSIGDKQRAQAQVLHSEGHESRTEPLVSGTGKVDITFTMADNPDDPGNPTQVTLSIDAEKSSMEDIVKAINAETGLAVSATLMNDGTGSDSHRLMLSADKTGVNNAIASISISSEDFSETELGTLDSMLSFGGESSAMTEREARDAQLTVNGISVKSQGNTIENVIDGVTLTLAKTTEEGQFNTLRVTRDDGVATTAVNNFVNAYNALQSTIKSLTAYDVDSQSSAALTGDSLARSAQTRLRDAISGFAIDGMTLSSIGVTTDPISGNLKVDTEKLNEALQSDRAGIERLFADESGLSKRVSSAVEVFTKSDGLIKVEVLFRNKPSYV